MNTYYMATESMNGLKKGKIYFEGSDKKITLEDGNKVSAAPLIWKRILMPLPHYEGNLREEWSHEKTKLLVEVSDGMMAKEMTVKLVEVHQIKKKSLVCLAIIPGVKGKVQLDIPHLYIV